MASRLLSALIVMLAVVPALSQEASSRLSVPDESAQKAALALIAEVYKSDYDQAKTPQQKITLAKKLLKEGIATKNDPAGRYVLLRIARDIAAQNGDVDTSFQAIAQIDIAYQIDSLKMKSAAVSGAAKALRKPDEQKQLVARTLALIDDAVAADRYDLTTPLGEIALSSARKARDTKLTRQVVDRNKELGQIEQEYEKVKEALAVLDGKPTDPVANLTVGKFRCFVQEKWEVGIPMLALGGDASVKALAAKELADKPDALALGDGWWALAEKEEGTAKGTIQAHAAEWYRKALPDLEGLAKAKVEKRLEEVVVKKTGLPVIVLKPINPNVVSVRRIWDRGTVSSYTDLIYAGDQWFCVFREATGPLAPDGVVRIIRSKKGVSWSPAGLIKLPGFDLREPKICVTPDNQLMLTVAATKRSGNKTTTVQSFTTFSADGTQWSGLKQIGDPGMRLGRPAWHKGRCFVVGYSNDTKARYLRLYDSKDGRHFDTLVDNLYSANLPSETTLLFDKSGHVACVVRCGGADDAAAIGQSQKPFRTWTWKRLNQSVASPCVLRLPDGRTVLAGRFYAPTRHTGLSWLDFEKGTVSSFIALPSGGDTGYPGMVLAGKYLWVSYYSSHEGKTSIYLAQVQMYE